MILTLYGEIFRNALEVQLAHISLRTEPQADSMETSPTVSPSTQPRLRCAEENLRRCHVEFLGSVYGVEQAKVQSTTVPASLHLEEIAAVFSSEKLS